MKTIWTDQKIRAEHPHRLAWYLNKLERIANDAAFAVATSLVPASGEPDERLFYGPTLLRLIDSIKSLAVDDFDAAAVTEEG